VSFEGKFLRCDICGKSMFAESLMNTKVKMFTLKGFSKQFHAHLDCGQRLKDCKGNFNNLPNGPLKAAFKETIKKRRGK